MPGSNFNNSNDSMCKFLPSLRRLIILTILIVTFNLFLVVQQLPPHLRSLHRRVNLHAEPALRQFFGLAPFSQRHMACVVPDFPLFNDDFNRIYRRDIDDLLARQYSCASSLPQTSVKLDFDAKTSTLRLVSAEPPVDRCVLKCVIRDSDNEISFSQEQTFIDWKTTVVCDFFRLTCFRGKLPVYSDLHSRIVLTQPLSWKPPKNRPSRYALAKPFNVIMFGMDGVSRQNFLRLMNRTRSFFERTMRFIDFKIYNKVRDNTFVNVVPMTTGRFADDLPWNETIAAWTPFDDFNFIWKDFANSRTAYRTVYAEDFPEISIFNYLKMGFNREPVDYYFRPMNLAMTADRDAWHGDASLCFKNRFEVDYVFDYVRSALLQAKLASDPYFAFVYLTRITHEDQALAVVADRVYSDFFEKLSTDRNMLLDPERTIVILFSDHGTRWGNYRTTIYGKYEERLPVFSMALPKTFETEFPTEFENLLENSKKLITPFDVYHSLKDLLHASESGKFRGQAKEVDKQQIGLSLFGKIPWTRSCEQAGVEQHWCACHESTQLDSTSPSNVELGLSVVTHLNAKLLAAYSTICSNWTLSSLLEIRLLKPNDKFLLFKKSVNDVNDRTVQFDRDFIAERTRTRLAFYLVTVLVKPPNVAMMADGEDGALFEATVHARIGVDGRRSDLRVEGVSRLNAYGSQSNCIEIHSLKPFCYCRNNK